MPSFAMPTITAAATSLCTVNGNLDQNCAYDYALTNNPAYASATLAADVTVSAAAAQLGKCQNA